MLQDYFAVSLQFDILVPKCSSCAVAHTEQGWFPLVGVSASPEPEQSTLFWEQIA